MDSTQRSLELLEKHFDLLPSKGRVLPGGSVKNGVAVQASYLGSYVRGFRTISATNSRSREYVVVGRTIAVTLMLCVALAGCAHASRSGNGANELDRLANGFIATLSEQDKDALKKAEKADLPMFPFGAGSRVRQLYFGPAGENRKAFCTQGAYCDIDHDPMRIVERAWQIIRGVG